MHSLIKNSFYIIFLIAVALVSIRLLYNSKGDRHYRLLGLALLILGLGEGFHLLPRILEIFTHDMTSYTSWIETGRFISSLSILLVFFLLFKFWKVNYYITVFKSRETTFLVLGGLSIMANILLRDHHDTLMIMLRNTPMIFMSLILIYNYKTQAVLKSDQSFKYLWLALLMSVLFTVLFEVLSPMYGFFVILMMPKTLMYIWLVLIANKAYKRVI